MSRKSDISQAWNVYIRECIQNSSRVPYKLIVPAPDAAYNLGRAAQAEECAAFESWPTPRLWREKATRLRAKVRKMADNKEPTK